MTGYALVGCGPAPEAHYDGPTTLTYGGHQYFSSLPASLHVPETAAHQIGLAVNVENRPPTLIGDAVYGLDGVDPAKIVAMKSSERGKPVLLFVATDFLTGSPPNELALKVPGICAYVPREPGCG